MKILNLSLDNSILNKASASAKRIAEYGELVEKYIAITPDKKIAEIELSEKVAVYGSGGVNKFWQFFKIYQLAKKTLSGDQYQIITVQDQYYLALIGLCLSKKFKIGLEIQVHGFEKYSSLRKLITKYVLPRASAVRCVSQRLKKELIGRFGVAEEKITVVPVYSESIDHNPRPTVRQNNKFVFLTVGRLVSVKNVGLQLAAMREIIKKHPEAELWIIGDGPECNNLKFKIRNLKLDDNIKLLGKKSREELYSIYVGADAFVLSSDSEGYGLAVIEAAAHGLPIIMTDVGCAGEVIVDKQSGLVVPTGSKEKLTVAMLALIENEDLRKRLGQAALAVIKKLPDKRQILSLYKESWEKAAIKK